MALLSQNIRGQEVVDLTTKTFEHETQATTGATTGNWFVMFYAPWCGHCNALKPAWKEAAKMLSEQEEDSYTTFAAVDCTVNRIVCQRFEVRGYPTLIFFHKGKMVKYEGARRANALLEFVNNGYQKLIEESGEDIPVEITWWSQTMAELRKEFNDLVTNRKGFLASLMVGSIVFGILIGYLIEGGSSKPSVDPKFMVTPEAQALAAHNDKPTVY